jgi:Flp pilus assembly protein TadD
MGNGGNGSQGHTHERAEVVLTETLSPTYMPSRSAATVLAPVLELEGLEPWAEIQGPALALEEPSEGEEQILTFDDPAQLVLAPFAARLVASISGAAPRFELEESEAGDAESAAENEVLATAAEDFDAPPFLDEVEVAVAEIADDPPEDTGFTAEAAAAEVEAPVAAPEPPAPDPAEILYAEARDAAEAGRVEDAKQLYRQLLALHPTHVRARNNLALILDAEGNHQGALAELDRALEIESENGTLLVNRGALLGAMGRYAAAERDLKKVLRVEPSHAEALFNLGVVMTKKGLWGEAVPHLKRAVELEPQRAAAHYYLGEALNHVDDLTGALAAYQRAAELQPSNPRALYGLGIIYDRLARPDDAAQMYRRSREVSRR